MGLGEYKYTECMKQPWRLEGNVLSPGTEITDGSELSHGC